jgi:hypothetical protein
MGDEEELMGALQTSVTVQEFMQVAGVHSDPKTTALQVTNEMTIKIILLTPDTMMIMAGWASC